MKRLNNQLESKIVNSIVDLIVNNQKNIVGAYVVPFSFGEEEKLQVTLVRDSEQETIENSNVEMKGITLIINSNPWSMYQKESDLDDSLYMKNYLQIRDLKNAEIVYDPKGCLASKKEELRKKPGTLTYYNLSAFFQGVVKISKKRLQEIPKIEDVGEELTTTEKPKRKRKRKKANQDNES